MSTAADSLQRTPLFEQHRAAGARLVPFAGWEMPVLYEGVIAEHNAVRMSAGLFDVSHMGQLWVSGPGSFDDLQRLLSNDLARLTADGMAQYTLLLTDHGGVHDDLIVYRVRADEWVLVVNASNIAHDLAVLSGGLSAESQLDDRSANYSMLALQGPQALGVLVDRCGIDVRQLEPFRFVVETVHGMDLTVATTGYTGERGCEILVSPDHAGALWDRLLEDDRVRPAGLGARDTLRLEVCYPLHGNDLSQETSAVAAGLSWVCGWDTEFVGRDALLAERERGPRRRLVAVRADGRGIPRAGCTVMLDAKAVGIVTSGTLSPTLGMGVALAYVDAAHANVGTHLQIDVRGRLVPVRVEQKPLYCRAD